jgi:hypothetical protein
MTRHTILVDAQDAETLRMFTQLSGDQIVAELWRLNIRYFHRVDLEPQNTPAGQLLASMAMSDEPRLRMALVPLFTEQPDLSACVEAAATTIEPSPHAEELRLYYQAAVYLQREIGARGKAELPDLYSVRYGAPSPVFGADEDQTDLELDVLASHHAKLPMPYADLINWRNGYRQHIPLHMFKVARQQERASAK